MAQRIDALGLAYLKCSAEILSEPHHALLSANCAIACSSSLAVIFTVSLLEILPKTWGSLLTQLKISEQCCLHSSAIFPPPENISMIEGDDVFSLVKAFTSF